MALSGKSHGRKLSFTLNSHDVSTNVEEVDGLPGEVELGDITTAGSVGHVSWPGLEKATITVKGVFDDASNSLYEVASAELEGYKTATPPAPVAFIYGPAGTTSGYVKISGNCWVKNIAFPAKVTDPLKFTVTLEADNGYTIGVFT